VSTGKLSITEHFFDVPKDYSKPEDGTIRIFARSARKHEVPIVPDPSKDTKLPWMVYLQGGPGMSCRSPQNYPWTHKMLDNGYQMLYLDQRGTGLSTPISASTLQKVGGVREQVEYLRLFRADNNVRDAEAIRQALTEGEPDAKRKWSTVGQSFGGFCTLTYLSLYPQALRECFLFGGLGPLVNSPDDVYKRLYKKVLDRNDAYYNKYPEDVARVKQIL
jgi:pimeloyl-ACP methyl ester carboxylesterase